MPRAFRKSAMRLLRENNFWFFQLNGYFWSLALSAKDWDTADKPGEMILFRYWSMCAYKIVYGSAPSSGCLLCTHGARRKVAIATRYLGILFCQQTTVARTYPWRGALSYPNTTRVKNKSSLLLWVRVHLPLQEMISHKTNCKLLWRKCKI